MAGVTPDRFANRPVGLSSKLRKAPGRRRPWRTAGGVTVPLPIVVDLVELGSTGGALWWVEATVDLVDGAPALVKSAVEAPRGMDPHFLQANFRWATPLEIVTRLLPRMIAAGRDPFEDFLPYEGFPQAGRDRDIVDGQLSEEFLEDVALEYLEHGRGYAAVMSRRYGVSERTVVSWVSKARQRGILTPTTPGRAGGRIVPAQLRPPG